MPNQQEQPFKWQYFFTIDTRIDGAAVGDVPGGFRMDIAYEEGGRVFTDGEKYFRDWIKGKADLKEWWTQIEGVDGLPAVGALDDSRTAYEAIATVRKLGKFDPYSPEVRKRTAGARPQLEWFGLEGEISTGSDWTIVRDDGVVRFEGRVTIRSSDEERALLDTSLRAVVDLRDRAKDSIPDGASMYRKWRSSNFRRDEPVRVVFAAAFESTQQTPPSWAPKRYAKQAAHYWKHSRLNRGQFVAVGTVGLDPNLLSPLTVDVYEVYR
jgi:hypothetical protein